MSLQLHMYSLSWSTDAFRLLRGYFHIRWCARGGKKRILLWFQQILMDCVRINSKKTLRVFFLIYNKKFSWCQQAEQHRREVTYAPVWQRFPPYPGRQSGYPRASATHVPPFNQGLLAMEHTLISTKNVLYPFLVLPKYSEHFNGGKWTSVCSFQHRKTLLKISN